VQIPQASPVATYTHRKNEIDAAVKRVLEGGWYILGSEVEAFTQEFAAWHELHTVVGVGNGTDAIELMLRALDIGGGDEVITTPHTATATVSAIEHAGATPVLVDIEANGFNIDPIQVEKAITPRTKVIMPVHLYGVPANLDALGDIAARYQVTLLEDCAQAHGARYHGKRVGTFGKLSSFSFYPTKNLGAFGDGGAVGTMDAALGERVRSLAQYGWRQRYISDEPGLNSRLDELQAAILRVKLRDLEADNARRRQIAACYQDALREVVTVPAIPDDCEPVFHLYVIRTPQRDALAKYLKERGIGTAIHYPVPLHLQPAYRGRLGDTGSFPQVEQVMGDILSLPLYPELTDEQVNQVIEAIHSFFP